MKTLEFKPGLPDTLLIRLEADVNNKINALFSRRSVGRPSASVGRWSISEAKAASASVLYAFQPSLPWTSVLAAPLSATPGPLTAAKAAAASLCGMVTL